MAKRKPGHYRGKGRPSFTMKPGTPMPQSMHPAIRKAERDISKLKEVAKAGRKKMLSAAAARKTGSAVVKYKPPTTPKPVAPTPSPAPAAKPAAKQYGRIGRSKVGRLLTGQTGKSLIKGAVGKSFLRRAATRIGGTALRFGGPIGAAYGAVVGARDIVKAGYHGGKLLKLKSQERGMAKRSKAKYGTIAAAARTRKARTGR